MGCGSCPYAAIAAGRNGFSEKLVCSATENRKTVKTLRIWKLKLVPAGNGFGKGRKTVGAPPWCPKGFGRK